MRKIILLLIVNLFFLVKGNTFTLLFDVTDPIMNNTESLDTKLQAAINWVNQDPTYHAVVRLNSPDGLIDLTYHSPLFNNLHEIPIINNTQGAITIIPHPDAVEVQGLRHPNNPGNIIYGFRIYGNTGNTIIRGLVFENFPSHQTAVYGTIDVDNSSSVLIDNCVFKLSYKSMYLFDSEEVTIRGCVFTDDVFPLTMIESENVLVENCSFSNSFMAIKTESTADLTIDDNTFYSNESAIICEYEPTLPLASLPQSRKIHIKDNNITVPNTLVPQTQSSGIIVNVNGHCQEVFIEDNHIDGAQSSIVCNNNTTNNLCAFKVKNNLLINGDFGIFLGSPRSFWEVDNNFIYYMDDVGIKLTSTLDPDLDNSPPINASINFINTNTIAETLDNSNNKIENCNTSFYFNTKSGNSSKIIGYKVDGKIVIDGSWPIDIRENIINISGSDTKPIELINSGNKQMTGLVIEQVQYNGFDVIIDFKIDETMVNANNYGPYEVEFFISGTDNDLLEYLGRSSNVVGNGQTVSVNLTSANLSLIGKVGGTITSYSQSSGYKVGTSKVVYETYSIDQAPTCDACGSFKVDPTVDYWMSAWVKVDHPDQVITYEDATGPEINIFGVETGAINQTINLTPEGAIIDGWQRIVGKLEIPDGTENIYLSLKSDETFDTYFDDIRMHPFNASMKSYVYDGETFWLTSELDDNNYATFYEYDNEGGLVRIKKETSRGIVTIQETRSHTSTED